MAAKVSIGGSIWSAQDAKGRKVWYVTVDYGRDVRGKRIRPRRTAHSLAEAKQIQTQMWIESKQSRLAPVVQDTISEYANWWLQSVKRNRVRESTLGDYEYRLKQWVLPRFGHMRVTDVTARIVEEWLKGLHKSGLSIGTVNGARTMLSMLLEHAARAGLISANPVRLTDPLKRQLNDPTQVQEPWTLQEVRAALDAVRGTPCDLLVVLGVAYGLRRGEILGLKWQDVDFERGVLRVRHALKQARVLDESGGVSVTLMDDDTKTLASRRELPLSPLVLEALARHTDLQRIRKTAAGSRWRETDYVLTTSIGTPVGPSNMRRQLVTLLRQRGVRVIRIHDMRHTAAVQALESGESLEVVSQALGHTDINTTKSIYAPHVPAYNTRFAESLSERFHPFRHELDTLVEASIGSKSTDGGSD